MYVAFEIELRPLSYLSNENKVIVLVHSCTFTVMNHSQFIAHMSYLINIIIITKINKIIIINKLIVYTAHIALKPV